MSLERERRWMERHARARDNDGATVEGWVKRCSISSMLRRGGRRVRWMWFSAKHASWWHGGVVSCWNSGGVVSTLTPLAPHQLIGSPMAVPCVVSGCFFQPSTSENIRIQVQRNKAPPGRRHHSGPGAASHRGAPTERPM